MNVRLRDRVLPAVDRMASALGIHWILQRRLAKGLVVLMYHKVLPDGMAGAYPLENLVVRESDFHEQMRWLSKHAHVLPLQEAVAEQGQDARCGRPHVSVTFDDGYRDNAEVAAPVLDQHGLRATFYVTTAFVAGSPLWFDAAAWAHGALGAGEASELAELGAVAGHVQSFVGELKAMAPDERRDALLRLRDAAGPPPDDLRYAPMSPGQLRELASAGHEVGSHTVSHPLLTQLDDAGLERELVDSRQALASWLGEAPTGFCYPNGSHDDRVVAAVRAAGYDYACTTRSGANPAALEPYRLRRRMISPTNSARADGRPSGAVFAGEVTGFHDMIRRVSGRRPDGGAR